MRLIVAMAKVIERIKFYFFPPAFSWADIYRISRSSSSKRERVREIEKNPNMTCPL